MQVKSIEIFSILSYNHCLYIKGSSLNFLYYKQFSFYYLKQYTYMFIIFIIFIQKFKNLHTTHDNPVFGFLALVYYYVNTFW